MSSSTLTAKGQVTIPRDVRDFLDLEPGDQIVYVPEDKGRVAIMPVKGNILNLYGSVRGKTKSSSFKEFRQRFEKEMALRQVSILRKPSSRS